MRPLENKTASKCEKFEYAPYTLADNDQSVFSCFAETCIYIFTERV